MDEIEQPTYKNPGALAQKWIKKVQQQLQAKQHKEYIETGRKIVKNYRNQSTWEATASQAPSARVMYNVLWSNVQVLKPTLYSRMPKVVVERRFKDSDPIGRLACQGCERATSFALATQQDRYNYSVKGAVEDRLLPGCGQVWIRYDVAFQSVPDAQGETVTDSEGAVQETIKPNSERVVVDPIFWEDYLRGPGRNSYEVKWMARRVYMCRDELIKRFGDIGKEVPIASQADKLKDNDGYDEQLQEQAEIWEIWDEPSKQIIWICLGYDKAPLDIKPDVLKLDDFFPCPQPLLATTTTNTIYPVPDYKIYERLAEEMDFTTKRLGAMVECVRLVGATAAQFNADIKSMLSLKDGQLWPIEAWGSFVEKGGLAGAIDWLPFEQCVAAIQPLMMYRDSLLQQINSVTGIPDIALGSSDPTETLGSQQLKSRWTVVKIEEKQADVQRFCRQIISKVAQIIFEPGLFTDETIYLMAGVAQMTPEEQANWPLALQLLRDDRMRTFRIDIETDSTIATDEDEDKQSRMQYIEAINSLVSNLQNVSQFRPELIHPMIQSALFATRAFRTGRSLEGAWEKALQLVEDNDKAAAENPPPPPVDYTEQQIQLAAQDLAIKDKVANNDYMIEQQKLQLQGQSEQMNFEIQSQKVQIEGMKLETKAQIDAAAQELAGFKENFSQFIQQQRLELEKFTSILQEKDRALQEVRLQQEDKMEALKILHQNQITSAKPAPARRKLITVERDAKGRLVGEMKEVDEPNILETGGI